MNRPQKHKKQQRLYWLWLLAVSAFIACLYAQIARTWDITYNATIAPPRAVQGPTEAVKSPVVEVKGQIMKVTGFSDIECGSAWCNRHEPKDGQVALNYAKYGRHDKVYIPAYDKTYRVVGNTDGKTDLDIWFGDDQQAAKQFGVKSLRVIIL
jgi:hypothetical protein